MSRSFTVDSAFSSTSGKKLKFTGGRYISDIPYTAVRKAFSQISKNMKGKKVTLEIHLRETTQNSAHKIYKYKVSRKYSPTEVKIKDNTIVYKYKYTVKAI